MASAVPGSVRGNVGGRQRTSLLPMWQHISTAPYHQPLQLAVVDGEGLHALVFPCERGIAGWVNASNRQRVDVDPTHWRPWPAEGVIPGTPA